MKNEDLGFLADYFRSGLIAGFNNYPTTDILLERWEEAAYNAGFYMGQNLLESEGRITPVSVAVVVGKGGVPPWSVP